MKLFETDPHPHNRNAVLKYEHKRYSYDLSSFTNDVPFQCVLRQDLQRQIVNIPDYDELILQYSNTITFQSITSDANERRFARFYQLMGIQVSTIPEAQI